MSRWLRDAVSFGVVLSVLAGLAGFAWLTRNPEAEIVAEAEAWPVIGPVASAFRERFVPPAPPAFEPQPYEVSMLDLPERRDEGSMRWREDGFEPWRGDGPPPLGSEPAPPLPLPGRPADPEKLQEARALFAAGEHEGRLGPYALYTDVRHEPTLRRLAAVAEQAEALYRERYGLEPVGETLESVLLYRREQDYRALQAGWERIRGLDSMGHTGYGLVALFVGELETTIVEQALLHEIGHLLNRRSLGPALPPWLEEGLADDLSYHRLDDHLRLEAPQLAELRSETEEQVTFYGALAGLDLLVGKLRQGSLPSLASLTTTEWQSFVADGRASASYAESLFFVRYLLDDAVSGRAEAFREFLTGVSRGESVLVPELEAKLGQPLAGLESDWRLYLLAQAVDSGLGARLVSESEPSS
jgi:hypothetical protein